MSELFWKIDPKLAVEFTLVIIGVIFGIVMSYRSASGEKSEFVTYVLQAVMALVSLGVLVSQFAPGDIAQFLDQKAFLVMLSAMVLIYSSRDIVEHFSKLKSLRDRNTRSHQDPAE